MEYTGNRGVFKLVSGGNEQTFMVIRGFDSHSETFTTNLLRMDPGEMCMQNYLERRHWLRICQR